MAAASRSVVGGLRLTSVPWRLAERPECSDGPTVLTTFSCGGGSSMGYRLAGCRVVGAVEVDPKVAAIYEHNLKHAPHVAKIQDFRVSDVAERYAGVDVLDGSPPCTLFSVTRRGGRRESEKLWAQDAQLREGGVSQRVNDLFFEFVALAERLRPRVVVAENVKGMVVGRAKGYAKLVLQALRDAGYSPQLFLLDSSRMGVAQRRERVFFVASRTDLGLPPLELAFSEPAVPVIDALRGLSDDDTVPRETTAPVAGRLWKAARPGQTLGKAIGRPDYLFNHVVVDPMRPAPTITAGSPYYHWQEPRELSVREKVRLQSFPDDYDFWSGGPTDDTARGIAQYVLGMSVPPLMVERLVREVVRQWL